MPSQTIDDMTLYYQIHGDGFPLLLLHGFSGTSSQWTPFVQQLESEYKLVVPDLPSHGRSLVPPGDFSHKRTALWMFKLLDVLNIGNFSAIGFSSGGTILLHMATQQPDRVNRMVLWSTSAFPTEQAQDRLAMIDPKSITEKEWPWLSEHVGGPSQIRWVVQQFHSLKDRKEDIDFSRSVISAIKAQTLIIHGDRDEFHPVRTAVALYEALQEAFLWTFPNTYHMFPEDTILEIIQRCRAFFSGFRSTADSVFLPNKL